MQSCAEMTQANSAQGCAASHRSAQRDNMISFGMCWQMKDHEDQDRRRERSPDRRRKPKQSAQ